MLLPVGVRLVPGVGSIIWQATADPFASTGAVAFYRLSIRLRARKERNQ
jgi:hypothetical protein